MPTTGNNTNGKEDKNHIFIEQTNVILFNSTTQWEKNKIVLNRKNGAQRLEMSIVDKHFAPNNKLLFIFLNPFHTQFNP